MKFDTLIPGSFVQRDNRFRVQVKVGGSLAAAHLPNSGRLGELLVPERRVWLTPIDLTRRPHRRTAYDVALFEYAGQLVSVDARLPNKLVAEALRAKRLAGFREYAVVEQEVALGNSRIDLRLNGGSGRPVCWIEVKSVTLVEEGVARFPDAPTRRGRRHVRELMGAVARGERAAVIFVVQREDARCFSPYDRADPEFGRVLREAATNGVEVRAWHCQVSLKAIRLAESIPVLL
jgi:sugar fermentation stimulation protein A